MDGQEKLKVCSETSVKLFITPVTVKCMILKIDKYIVNQIFYRYFNHVIRKDQIIFRYVCPFSTGITKHWETPGALLLIDAGFFQQLIILENLHWV